jgi:autotransporter family porin
MRQWRPLLWPGAVVLVVALFATVAIVLTGGAATEAAPADSARPDVSLDLASSPTPSPVATVDPTTTPSTTPATPAAAPPAPPPPAAAPARFGTLPPGSALPSGAQCAAWVRASAYPENKGANRTANQTTGHAIGSAFFSGDDARANTVIGPRVDGQFTGTTGQILRWAACKWGVDEELVFAQAAIESWWQQGTLGDYGTDASRCAPGRGLGVDGKPGQCPESFGILQNRYPYEQTAWPGIANSTAMNADLGYAIFRVCFEGYETWLNTVERGQTYAPGDVWGCVGRWFSGRWHTQAGEDYVARVKGYLDQKIWTTPNFQQP